MKNTIKLLSLLALSMMLFSFTPKKTDTVIGIYGVSASDPSAIKLTINADHTFFYQDFSDPNQKLEVEGNWTLRGKKVVLTSNSGASFHDVWSITDEGQIAKSHKGLSFYRLCRLEGK